MKLYIRDLHFLHVTIFKEDENIYDGAVEEVPVELRDSEITKMYLDGKVLIVNI
ncbi:MAG: hypothetical protein PHP54_04360 [Clostridia bacterium]|nr:hypothetical protein [Clostridia bacterium]